MPKIIQSSLIVFLLLFLFPSISHAINNQEEIFEAQVIEVIEERQTHDEKGNSYIQQHLKLKGLKDKWTDKEFEFNSISDIQVIKSNQYNEGDKVIVSFSIDEEANEYYYILDYVRRGNLYLMAVIFILAVIAVGRWKGLRSLIALALTFLIIFKFIIPRILAGNNAILITIAGSIAILILIVYITWGKNKKSDVALISIILSLIATGILAWLFTLLTKLTGLGSEEAIFLTSLKGASINIQGLLLAGIIVGALGVLDDIAIAQVSTVNEIQKANPELDKKEVYKRAMRVGTDHLGSMVNTLFLAYAGASLPLLMLFSIKEPPFLTFSQVINNEIIATEIVRTLTGSLGLLLAVPLTTFLAVRGFVKKKDSK